MPNRLVLTEEHSSVSDDAALVTRDVGAGRVADFFGRRELVQLPQAVQHDARRKDAAHANLIVPDRMVDAFWIESLECVQR